LRKFIFKKRKNMGGSIPQILGFGIVGGRKVLVWFPRYAVFKGLRVFRVY
jgi:hypothetical protein